MPNSYKILCTICARGGSKGLKNKNILTLCGKPLIAYSIEQALRWGGASHVIVSTDSEKIASIAKKYKAEVPFMRPGGLAKDTTGKIGVLRHALIKAEKYYGIQFSALLDLDATSPVRSTEDIDTAIGIFRETSADCVFSVTKARKNPYFNMVEKKEDGSVALCKKPDSLILNRQSAPAVYDMNASILVCRRDFLLDKANKTPYSGTSYFYEMKETGALDIDSEIDFKFIEFLIEKGIIKI